MTANIDYVQFLQKLASIEITKWRSPRPVTVLESSIMYISYCLMLNEPDY